VLTELKNIRQRPGALWRRWFQSQREELIVWYSRRSGRIAGFQFCYALNLKEHAFTWKAGKGFSHALVDDGEGNPLTYKRTPILVRNGVVDGKVLRARFDSVAGRLPRQIAFVVRKKLLDLR